VQRALDDAGFELEAAGAAVTLSAATARSIDSARSAAQAAEKAGAALILTDLPGDWTLAVADAVKLPCSTSAHPTTACASRTAGRACTTCCERTHAQRAIAQTLVSRKWSKLLLLVGASPLDQPRSATAQASIKRYGLQVVASKPFKLSTDPRERDLANPLLLTAGNAYDAVWVSTATASSRAPALPHGAAAAGGRRRRPGRAGLACAVRALRRAAGLAPLRQGRQAADDRATGPPGWPARPGRAAAAAPKGPNAAWAQALARPRVDGSKGVA
jgi:hypothetical protein